MAKEPKKTKEKKPAEVRLVQLCYDATSSTPLFGLDAKGIVYGYDTAAMNWTALTMVLAEPKPE